MLQIPTSSRKHAMHGLGQVASVVLDRYDYLIIIVKADPSERFEPFFASVALLALDALREEEQLQE